MSNGSIEILKAKLKAHFSRISISHFLKKVSVIKNQGKNSKKILHMMMRNISCIWCSIGNQMSRAVKSVVSHKNHQMYLFWFML